MSNNPHTDFYRQFEERFRTSRDNIKQRLRVYQPLLTFLQSHTALPTEGRPQALDLGCGRGEWLELLLEQGFQAQGVDLDAGMLAACKELNLPAAQDDALNRLSQTPDNSLVLVSAFHMVEHIPFEMLLDIVSHALRVLKPGGILLMETPNPENISVGTSSFYLDPTHSKPIPHDLLAFVTEYKGFAAQQVWRVNESVTLGSNDSVSLHDLVFGVSPDYAVVAIKSETSDIVTHFESVMRAESGVALDPISRGYDLQIADRFSAIENRLAKLEQSEHLANTPKPSRVRSYLRRIVRVARRFQVGVKDHGVSGLWLPLAQYLTANPRRRNNAMRRLRRWRLSKVSAALFNETAISADLITHAKPAPVMALPPSVQAIDDLVLTELFTHIEQ